MEIGQHPASGYSKEHQKTYQEWFAFADSGPIPIPITLAASPPL
jgi:hypothetical protein